MTKYETIIFLDIDEVLVTAKSSKIKKKFWYNENIHSFDKKCVKNFNVILRTTRAKVVLSSSWRLYYTLNELDKIFKFNKVERSPIAITNEKGDRNIEIMDFLKENIVTNFLIIDDLSLTCFPDKFMRITGKQGLTEDYIEKAIIIIDKQSNI